MNREDTIIQGKDTESPGYWESRVSDEIQGRWTRYQSVEAVTDPSQWPCGWRSLTSESSTMKQTVGQAERAKVIWIGTANGEDSQRSDGVNSQASCEHKDKTSKANVVQQETQRWPVTTMSSWRTGEGELTRHGLNAAFTQQLIRPRCRSLSDSTSGRTQGNCC